ncbi:lysosomal alpha-glucosidase [Engraulis encrasicolus]|uniref:lysosomal alpha-glucosidase n=1 Tax=Engraulis encrasicolus TaxID=184585 RepID=UPI002FD5F8BA
MTRHGCLTLCLSLSILLFVLTVWNNLPDHCPRTTHTGRNTVAATVTRALSRSRSPSPLNVSNLNSTPHSGSNGAECSTPPEKRFDCARDRALSRAECESRGCCYVPLPAGLYGGPPWCFYPPAYPGYSMGPLTPTSKGIVANLVRSKPSHLPRDLSVLSLEVETGAHLHITLKDPFFPRYEVPLSPQLSEGSSGTKDRWLDIKFQKDPFGFVVRRSSNGRVLLDTTVAPLLFADQYLQMSTSLPSGLISGLGEHYTPLTLDLNWTSVTLWNKDMAPHSDANLYGSHPFWLVQEGDGQAYGVLLLNSNAMEVVLQPMPALTAVSLGGILDLYVFPGPDPQSVVRQYQDVIGYPMMPPYWALGFHLCRWGYRSTNETRSVAQRMHEANFPLDVQWNDLDYANKRRVFTFDPMHFGDLPEMVEEFHQKGMRYILILDPGISSTAQPGSYWPYDEGLRRGVFIKNSTGQTLIGKVWPGPTAFPDFTNPETVHWWWECIRDFHAKVPVDGLWIDMNEPASFVHGSVDGCPDSDLENPPYVPDVIGGQLNFGTLCMSGQQNLSTHYNVHNLYGLTEAIATYSALLKVTGLRPFVLSRSSFPGLGSFSAHWTGDVRSTWEQLRYSVPAVLLFGLFGVPLVGADVCGFGGDTNEELCVRWTQLGAFYPFMRNHNDRPNAPQEPFVFSQEAQAAMRGALLLRYSLLPFLYTLFFRAHTSADTVARPLFLEFPTDDYSHAIDRQFLWGSSLLISPVLEQGSVELSAYFPPGLWYSLHHGQAYASKGQYFTLSAPLNIINVHVRGGHIVTQQEPALTTTAARRNPFGLVVALSEQGWATGELFWDDGVSLDTYKREDYSHIIFTVRECKLVSDLIMLNGDLAGLILGQVRVFGVPSRPRAVLANGETVADFTYQPATRTLTVASLSLPMTEVFSVYWLL